MAWKKRFRNRALLLAAIWIILLLVSLTFLSILLSFFAHNPQGEMIYSQSWSGYIISKANNPKLQVTFINASWVVPAVNATSSPQYASVWIGIGGQLDTTLIQAGTEQDSSNNQTAYYAWYELLPSYSVRIDTVSISPGDVVDASLRLVDSTANRWNIELSDSTTGQYFGTTVNYNSTGSSGEWILERPTVNGALTNLADFGTAAFNGCYLAENGSLGPIKSFYFTRIEMTNSVSTPLTSVSNISAGDAFRIKYVA